MADTPVMTFKEFTRRVKKLAAGRAWSVDQIRIRTAASDGAGVCTYQWYAWIDGGGSARCETVEEALEWLGS